MSDLYYRPFFIALVKNNINPMTAKTATTDTNGHDYLAFWCETWVGTQFLLLLETIVFRPRFSYLAIICARQLYTVTNFVEYLIFFSILPHQGTMTAPYLLLLPSSVIESFQFSSQRAHRLPKHFDI